MTKLPFPPGSIRSVLVIKLRAVGDVILSTIVLKNLRNAFPGARLGFLTEVPSADILRGNAGVDELLIYDKKSMSGLDLIRLVRAHKYDMVIDLFGNPRTALVTRLSGAKYRIGFRFRGRTYAYNIVANPRGSRVHNTQFNLDALEAAGIRTSERNLQYAVNDVDRAFVEAFFKKEVPPGPMVVGLNSGGGWYTKRWPLRKYAALADHIAREFGATIILIWGPGQLDEVEQIRMEMKMPGIIPPPTTLPQLAALLERCDAIVSNDSGPMHLAAAVGTPVLGIFGPTNPVLQGPYGQNHVTVVKEGLACLGCNLTKCPIGNLCMVDLSVEDVSAAFEELVRKNSLDTTTGHT